MAIADKLQTNTYGDVMGRVHIQMSFSMTLT